MLRELSIMVQKLLDESSDREASRLELAAARAEIDRLRGLLTEQVEKTPVLGVNIEGGAAEVVTRPPHWAVKALAASFVETLDGATNWRSVEVGPLPSDEGYLIVTVKRDSGDSPERQVEALKAENDKLRAMIEELVFCGVFGEFELKPSRSAQAIFDRARALINPEKKD